MNSVILKFIAHETIEFLSENYLQLKQFYNMINFKRLILMPNIFGGKNLHDMVTSTLCFAQCANCFYIFTARKRSLRRLCFHRYLSVHREGCGRTRGRHSPGRHPPAQCMLGYTHPCPMHAGIHPQRILQDTVNKRAVHIPLECILVLLSFCVSWIQPGPCYFYMYQ